MNISNIYGIAIGLISLLFGIGLLFLKKVDATLANRDSTEKDIRTKRLILGAVYIIAGFIILLVIMLTR